MKRARDQQRNVVDHIAIGKVLHELGQRTSCVGLKIAELGDKLLGGLICEGGGRWVRGERSQEVAICR